MVPFLRRRYHPHYRRCCWYPSSWTISNRPQRKLVTIMWQNHHGDQNKHNDRSNFITTAVLSSSSSSWSLRLRETDGLTIPSNRLPGLIDNGHHLPISFGKVAPSMVGTVNTKTLVLSYDPRRHEFVVCHKEDCGNTTKKVWCRGREHNDWQWPSYSYPRRRVCVFPNRIWVPSTQRSE